MNEVAYMTLWCKRKSHVFEFTVKVGQPRQIDDELWECDWSLGEMLTHQGKPLKNINSMLTLLTAIQFIGKFLEARAMQGDEFFINEQLTEKIDNFPEIFGSISISETSTSSSKS